MACGFPRQFHASGFHHALLHIFSPHILSHPTHTLILYSHLTSFPQTLSLIVPSLSGPRVWRCTASQDSFTRRLLPSSSTFLPNTLILYSHLAFTLRLPSRSSTYLPPYTVLSPTSTLFTPRAEGVTAAGFSSGKNNTPVPKHSLRWKPQLAYFHSFASTVAKVFRICIILKIA